MWLVGSSQRGGILGKLFGLGVFLERINPGIGSWINQLGPGPHLSHPQPYFSSTLPAPVIPISVLVKHPNFARFPNVRMRFGARLAALQCSNLRPLVEKDLLGSKWSLSQIEAGLHRNAFFLTIPPWRDQASILNSAAIMTRRLKPANQSISPRESLQDVSGFGDLIEVDSPRSSSEVPCDESGQEAELGLDIGRPIVNLSGPVPSLVPIPFLNFDPFLDSFGFASRKSGGGHLARSMMLGEVSLLLRHPELKDPSAFKQAIAEDNLLGKATFSSRLKSFRHLSELYGLDSSQALFRIFQQFAAIDAASIPLMAAVCAFGRDPQLRCSFALMEKVGVGENCPRAMMEAHLEEAFPSRFSPATKKSLAQNVMTSWSACGHLVGKVKKTKANPKPTVLATTYAMFAGYLAGFRGEILVDSVFARLVGADAQQVIAHLKESARQGRVRLRHAGGVTEIDFSQLLTEDELSLLHGAS
jgi:hypothetical protein